MITLYAITDHPTPPLPDDAPMRVVADGDLAILCCPGRAGDMTAEALWEHERRVESLMADRDLLPVRYGTCVPDEAAAVRALEDNRATYAASLDAVRGAVELAVRVFPTDDGQAASTPPPTTGTGYLRSRARSAAAETAASSRVHEPLARLARAAALAPVPRPGELSRAAYLVERDGTDAFLHRVRQLQEDNPDLRITCTGPWPPYSFSGT